MRDSLDTNNTDFFNISSKAQKWRDIMVYEEKPWTKKLSIILYGNRQQ